MFDCRVQLLVCPGMHPVDCPRRPSPGPTLYLPLECHRSYPAPWLILAPSMAAFEPQG